MESIRGNAVLAQVGEMDLAAWNANDAMALGFAQSAMEWQGSFAASNVEIVADHSVQLVAPAESPNELRTARAASDLFAVSNGDVLRMWRRDGISMGDTSR